MRVRMIQAVFLAVFPAAVAKHVIPANVHRDNAMRMANVHQSMAQLVPGPLIPAQMAVVRRMSHILAKAPPAQPAARPKSVHLHWFVLMANAVHWQRPVLENPVLSKMTVKTKIRLRFAWTMAIAATMHKSASLVITSKAAPLYVKAMRYVWGRVR